MLIIFSSSILLCSQITQSSQNKCEQANALFKELQKNSALLNEKSKNLRFDLSPDDVKLTQEMLQLGLEQQ